MTANFNLLRGSSVYLAGPIDNSVSDPSMWRNAITRDLLIPLGITVFDPLVKPSWLPENAKLSPQAYKDAVGDLVGTSRQRNQNALDGIRTIREICLQSVTACDFVIVNLPREITVGTFEEISVACSSRKPILFHFPDGPPSSWLFAQCTTRGEDEEFCRSSFSGWLGLYRFIHNVNSGIEKVTSLKWAFINYHNDPQIKEHYETSIDEQVGVKSF